MMRCEDRLDQKELKARSKATLVSFDKNRVFGPAITLRNGKPSRLRRWMRAYRYGLEPPGAVLKALMAQKEFDRAAYERMRRDADEYRARSARLMRGEGCTTGDGMFHVTGSDKKRVTMTEKEYLKSIQL